MNVLKYLWRFHIENKTIYFVQLLQIKLESMDQPKEMSKFSNVEMDLLFY